jgi:hypothetical protein
LKSSQLIPAPPTTPPAAAKPSDYKRNRPTFFASVLSQEPEVVSQGRAKLIEGLSQQVKKKSG